LKGGVRVLLDHPESTTLNTVREIHLQTGGGVNHAYSVEATRLLNRGAIFLKLREVDTCDRAEELRGQTVLIDEVNLPPTARGEFYDYQAIGCEIVTTDGVSLGTVEEIFGNGANDILVVRGNGRELLVPVIADVIKQLDFDAHRITVAAVPGLLD
jgi:16S rRNA processing protein RimM